MSFCQFSKNFEFLEFALILIIDKKPRKFLIMNLFFQEFSIIIVINGRLN